MTLESALQITPVVVVLGARQTGKTTMVRAVPALSGHRYFNLDEFDVRAQALEQPDALAHRAPAMVVDEVQRAPDLLLAIKRIVDEQRQPGRFVLTGSANLLMMERIGDSLSGRATYVTLAPMTRRELLGRGTTGRWPDLVESRPDQWIELLSSDPRPDRDWRNVVRIGGFPVPALELASHEQRSIWLEGYVQTYLERDLPRIRAIEDLIEFRRFMRAASLRVGSMLNLTELGRDVGTSQPQASRYLGVLEASFLAHRVEAYSVNRTKRLIQTPKLYWADTALAMHLAGEQEARGEHFENMVAADLLAWRGVDSTRPNILYWRTHTGIEVDFVIEVAGRLLPIEVKSARRAVPSDARALEIFLDEYPDLTDGGLFLHDGDEVFSLTSRVVAAPWWRVL